MPKILCALFAAALALAGCNTMQGAGRDVSAAGEAITDEAQEAQ